MLRDFILHVNSCMTPHELVHNASILFRQGRIVAVGGYSALRELDDIESVHLPDCFAVPGFVDTHIHGTGGFDAMDADRDESIDRMEQVLVSHGVTSFVPTLLSNTPEKMLELTAALARLCERPSPGAVPVGIHLEGPFLSREKRGAQPASYIHEVDLELVRELIQAGNGWVRTMTLAPELPGTTELIELLIENGVIPSLGHSMATGDQALAAVHAGASRATHLFNGMPPLNQRKTGLATAGLTQDSVTIELIVDGIHVHPNMVELACRTKPRARVVGISDATQGAGLAEGIYHLGQDEIRISDGASRRVSDGRLAGSCLTLDVALRNLRNYASLNDSDVVACYTSNAADSIGLKDRGRLQPGYLADIVVLDSNWEVQLTIVEGRVVYDRRGVNEELKRLDAEHSEKTAATTG